MARKEIDKTKSATFNEGAINDNFEELYKGEGSSFHTDPVSGYVVNNPYGGVVDNNDFDLGNMLSAMNSVLIQREIHDSTVKLQPTYIDGNGVTRDSYTHGPNVCIYNGKAYVTAFYNPLGTDHAEWPIADMRVAMFIFDLETWAIDKVIDNGVQQDFFCVAQHGSPVGAQFIASGAAEPLLHISDNGIVTVCFTARVSDNASDPSGTGLWYMCYRDYNIANGTWGDIGICQFKADEESTPVAMSGPTVGSVLGLPDIRAFEMFAQYAELEPRYRDANNNLVYLGYKEYYINISCESTIKNGAIVRTRDFKTYTLWLIPEWPVDVTVRNEMALATVETAWGRKLRVAARTQAEKTMFIGTIDFDDLDTDGVTIKTPGHVTTGISNMYRFIPDGGSRPCWFKTTLLSGLRQYAYLAHMTDIGERNRAWSAIDVVQGNSLNGSMVSRVATTLPIVYPAIAIATIGGKQKYVVAYMRGGRVYIAHFSLPRTFNELIPIAAKIIDTFGPSES